jgi:hypothetical protein
MFLMWLMQRKLSYINQGPGGYVVYTDGSNELKLFFEFGGGNCVAIIYIPTVEHWVEKTKIEIEERSKIIRFVAEQAIKNQAPNCNYKLNDDCILLLAKQ